MSIDLLSCNRYRIFSEEALNSSRKMLCRKTAYATREVLDTYDIYHTSTTKILGTAHLNNIAIARSLIFRHNAGASTLFITHRFCVARYFIEQVCYD